MGSTGTHKFQLKTVDHIGIHVRDCEKVIETWERMFGIGPWAILENSSTDAEGKTFTTRLAFAYLDELEIELIQPPEGRRKFIDTHGEGLNHWGFFVDDLKGETDNLVAQGATIVAQGPPDSWVYFDCGGPGGVIFELMKRRGKITDR